jgi:hypothetical protein
LYDVAARSCLAAERASSAVGCSRNSRKRSVARDSRLEQRDPRSRPEHEEDEPDVEPETAERDDGEEQHRGHDQRKQLDGLGVDHRDHDERDDVVDDEGGEHERAQAIREARPDDSEHAEHERGVRRHRRPPAVRGRVARVQREVDRNGRRSSSEPGEERQCEPPALANLAQVELPSRLEPDDEEEERHQPAVHPVA